MEKPLFVLAHPDDELLFAHAIAEHKNAGVIIATRGKASTVDRMGSWFVAKGRRSQESLHALGKLGLGEEQLHQYDLPDGELDFHFARLGGKIANLVLTKGYDSLYSFDESGYDGHPDHSTTYRAAQLVATARDIPHLVRSRIAESDTSTENYVTISGDAANKLTVVKSHASQWDANDPAVIRHLKDEYSGGFDREHYRRAA